VFLIKVDQSFSVAVRPEVMAAPRQIGAQLEVIVNLAIEDDLDGIVLVRDGLMTARQIDNAQPPDAEADSRFLEKALVIRPSMFQRAG
jgi:hypothetical protein